MIRVTSGKYQGRGVESPPRSKAIRPTTALMRECIFSKFQAEVPQCRFLDLFAGSGIMGLEALSRGAEFVLAIEQNPLQCRAIRKSYATIGISEAEAKVVPHDARALVAKPCKQAGFDLVFIDPPYGFSYLLEIVENCEKNGWLREEAILVVEQGSREPDLPEFTRKNFGDSALLFKRLSGSSPIHPSILSNEI